MDYERMKKVNRISQDILREYKERIIIELQEKWIDWKDIIDIEIHLKLNKDNFKKWIKEKLD